MTDLGLISNTYLTNNYNSRKATKPRHPHVGNLGLVAFQLGVFELYLLHPRHLGRGEEGKVK